MRGLFQFGGSRRFLTKDGFSSLSMAIFLGLEVDPNDHYDRRKALERLRADWVATEQQSVGCWQFSPLLADNLQRVQSLVGLNATECRLLAFFVLMRSDYLLDMMCDSWLTDLNMSMTIGALTSLLELDCRAVKQALSNQGKMISCGLVCIDDENTCASMLDRFHLVSQRFADKILSSQASPEVFMMGIAKISLPPKLTADLYGHCGRECVVMKSS